MTHETGTLRLARPWYGRFTKFYNSVCDVAAVEPHNGFQSDTLQFVHNVFLALGAENVAVT